MKSIQFLLFLFSTIICFTQTIPTLLNSKITECDNSLSYYEEESKLIGYEKTRDQTTLSFLYSTSCSDDLEIIFNQKNDTLEFITLNHDKNTWCECYYTANYTFKNLNLNDYKITFNHEHIPNAIKYITKKQPSDSVFNNKTINRQNKFGFKQGYWYTFHIDHSIASLTKYPDSVYYILNKPIWTKTFYPNKQIKSYNRKDSTESWFSDGVIKSQEFYSRNNDTIFFLKFERFEDKSIKTDIYEKQLDPFALTIRHKEYYSPNKLKHLFQNNTYTQWYKNGALKEVNTTDRTTYFDTTGTIDKIIFYPTKKKPFNYYINVTFKSNKVAEIKASLTNSNYYYQKWSWDSKGNLITKPTNWDQPLPWLHIQDIKFPKVE